jgi:hypothetical protein
LKELKATNSRFVGELEVCRETIKKHEIEIKKLRQLEEKKNDLDKIDLEGMKSLLQSNLQAVSTIDSFMKKHGINKE